jgi:hypothetical protein
LLHRSERSHRERYDNVDRVRRLFLRDAPPARRLERSARLISGSYFQIERVLGDG